MIIKGFEGAQYLGIGAIKSFLIYDFLDKLKQLSVAMGQRTVGTKWFIYISGLITQEIQNLSYNIKEIYEIKYNIK